MPTLTLQSVAYYLSSGTPTFQAVISKVDTDGKTWTITAKIPEADSQLIWASVIKSWGGGDPQATLQKFIDLGT